ncbi:hypothetical protein L2E82_02549 [Cichorium intybus]|uniref:Uncharacterized protein n=1 Tax=Cichorium intybus TaxID=13427 RepID=A0ACB9H391_CICIN|nr:hypothetical protein L2E82_02549 [Cichorium intybus]
MRCRNGIRKNDKHCEVYATDLSYMIWVYLLFYRLSSRSTPASSSSSAQHRQTLIGHGNPRKSSIHSRLLDPGNRSSHGSSGLLDRFARPWSLIENGSWGKKIKPVASHFCKNTRTQNRKIKKVGVTHSVLKSPIDEELLTFERPFFDERKVDPKTVASIILGGGAGTRLFSLTRKRAKPAVPIGGCYRLIDVPMSNCINSGIRKIFILTQFNSFSLNRHLARTYNFGNGMSFGDEFVEVLAATQTSGETGKKWFQGTADAVRQFIWVFEDAKNKNVENVLILSGDHLYRMDYMDFVQMLPAQTTYSCSISEDSCKKRKQIRSEAAD